MTLVYPEKVVDGLKSFFPDDEELADALDRNSGSAWDIVNDKLNELYKLQKEAMLKARKLSESLQELGKLHLELSEAGFPGFGD